MHDGNTHFCKLIRPGLGEHSPIKMGMGAEKPEKDETDDLDNALLFLFSLSFLFPLLSNMSVKIVAWPSDQEINHDSVHS